MIPRWIMTPGPNFTLNCDPSGSHFNVKFWSRVTIQRGILTRGHNSTWISDPSTYLLSVELRLNRVPKFNGAIKIQQLGRVIIQRKIHWIVTPGRYSMGGGGGVKILSYRHTGPLGRIYFHNRKDWYIYNIWAFATTLCWIQAFATTSCFRDKFKAFALYSHSIQVFATTTDCSSRIKQSAS